MDRKTVVFLSYNHEDIDLRKSIEISLKLSCSNCAEFISDDHTKTGKSLYDKISGFVDECDIIVPIITKNWLESHATRDETTRANDRKRTILVFFKTDDELDHKTIDTASGKEIITKRKITEDDLPHYMRGMARIHFDQNNIIEKLTELVKEIQEFQDHWIADLMRNLMEISDCLLTYNNDNNSRTPHARQILYASQEISFLKNDIEDVFLHNKFKKNVSYESNFLTQATPFFQTAERIYAVSFTPVSSFWTSDITHDAATEYLDKQSAGETKRVFRIFVFEKADDANNFKEVLAANYKAYGEKKGGVYLCSFESYERLTNEIGGDGNDITRKDFGVLKYNSNEYYHATLDPQDFIIEKCDFKKPRNFSKKKFIDYIENNLNHLADGGDYKGIIKWSPKFHIKENKEMWAEALKKMFAMRDGKITHLILFRSSTNKNEVFKKLLHLRKTLPNLKIDGKLFQLLGIDVLSKLENIKAIDGMTLSRLKISTDYDFAVIETFPTKWDLETYYENEIHSKERRDLYQIINPSLTQLFIQIDEIKSATDLEEEDQNSKIKHLWDEIEKEINKYMIRIDLVDKLPIDHISEQPGALFHINNIIVSNLLFDGMIILKVPLSSIAAPLKKNIKPDVKIGLRQKKGSGDCE